MKAPEIEADLALKRLIAIDHMDIRGILTDQGCIRPVAEWPDIWQEAASMEEVELYEGEGEQKRLVGVLKRLRLPDKLKNLELIGRHMGMFASSATSSI